MFGGKKFREIYYQIKEKLHNQPLSTPLDVEREKYLRKILSKYRWNHETNEIQIQEEVEDEEIVLTNEGDACQNPSVWVEGIHYTAHGVTKLRWKIVPDPGTLKIFIINSLDSIQTLITENHIALAHAGRDKTTRFLQESYYWSGLKNDVTRVIQTCEVCQKSKHGHSSLHEHLLTPILSKAPLDRVQFDFTFMPVTTGGYKCLLMGEDHFSKYLWVQACTSKEAKHVENLFDGILTEIGPHRKITIVQTDNGGEFRSETFQNKISEHGAVHVFGAPYHPQSQGSIERLNGTFKNILYRLWKEKGGAWIDHLNTAKVIYLTTHHETINTTPTKVWTSFLDVHPGNSLAVFQARRAMVKLQEALQARQKKRGEQAATRRAKKNAKKGKPLEEGDIVLINVPEKWRQAGDEKFEYEARIVERKTNGTCKVHWISRGVQGEKENTISKHCFRVSDMKRRIILSTTVVRKRQNNKRKRDE